MLKFKFPFLTFSWVTKDNSAWHLAKYQTTSCILKVLVSPCSSIAEPSRIYIPTFTYMKSNSQLNTANTQTSFLLNIQTLVQCMNWYLLYKFRNLLQLWQLGTMFLATPLGDGYRWNKMAIRHYYFQPLHYSMDIDEIKWQLGSIISSCSITQWIEMK